MIGPQSRRTRDDHSPESRVSYVDANPKKGHKPWRLAVAVDRDLTRRLTRPRPQPVDRALVRLSAVADHSILWLILAAAAAAFGGRRGKRAAEYGGCLALGFTSASVNGPLKLVFGRRRPPHPRPLRRPVHGPRPFPPDIPLRPSHSRSPRRESCQRPDPCCYPSPRASPIRGCTSGCTTRATSWPGGVRRSGGSCGTLRRAKARPRRTIDLAGIAGTARRRCCVVSPHAGNSPKLGRARRAFRSLRGPRWPAQELAIQDVARLPDLLRDTAGQPRLVIVAGGDGTVGSVAGYLAGADNSLGILPLGTGDDFARSVGIPINPTACGEDSGLGRGILCRSRLPHPPPSGADQLRPCRHGRTQR